MDFRYTALGLGRVAANVMPNSNGATAARVSNLARMKASKVFGDAASLAPRVRHRNPPTLSLI